MSQCIYLLYEGDFYSVEWSEEVIGYTFSQEVAHKWASEIVPSKVNRRYEHVAFFGEYQLKENEE